MQRHALRLAVLALLGCGRAEGPYLYVSNEGGNSISVIDTASQRVTRTIEVGKRPRGVALSPDGGLLYVALSGSPRGGPNVDERSLPPPDRAADGIGLVDLRAGRYLGKIAGGSDPETFDLTGDGKLLVVANEDAARATIVEASSRRILADVAVGGEPEGVRFTPDGREAYVTSEADNRVDVIDTTTRSHVAAIATGPRPRDVVFTSDGRRAFVSAELGACVDVIDTREKRVVASVPLPGEPTAKPMALVLDERKRRLYVSTGRAGRVAVVDVERLAFSQNVDGVGARPWGMALSPDGTRLYTANGPSNDVSVIDTRALRVLRKIPVGALPWGLALAATP